MKAREVNRKIERLGGIQTRQVGSHRRYAVEKNGRKAFTTVPQHTGDIPAGTLRAIERDLENVLGEGWLR
jgi:predicted RNA binding protein YcfA (HicA-like mRNA interferase family)